MIIYVLAYIIRPYVTDHITRRYFFSALTLRIIGALAIGFIYQFYYHGGDTFAYHTHGSRVIWDVLVDSPAEGINVFFSQGEYSPGTWKTAEKIWYWRDDNSFFVIQIAFLFDLITFSSYSGTAVLFAVLAFTGSWMFFQTFYQRYPQKHFLLALACLFIPSVVFWGSGLIKDTITLAGLGVLTYEIHRLFILRKVSTLHILLMMLALYCIFSIRAFILQAYVPAAILWVTASFYHKIHSAALRLVLLPVMFVVMIAFSFQLVSTIGKSDKRYALENLAETSMITAYDIRYWTGKDAGSGYSLGNLDGTMSNMAMLAPQAINVAMFRPYPWEANNILMVFAALESMIMMLLTLFGLFRYGRNFVDNFSNAEVLFALTFVLIFAFAVGISTFNFGSLVRYRIPILPFYSVALILLSSSRETVSRTDRYSVPLSHV
jgi:hypothetical protein